ncbi:tyrosine-type recombinase/integrase [Actinoplanes aureus]|uniref:Site-specific integrase n=1 Tax=Actinoplanes aureus TaxID=2792083 RepID=A0A931C586_9ACTN|nr:site-specific integrase [Actinoplanes aureus]MBG0560693.1 site-specific integrase [Actinoplanes aureus]
MWIEKHGPTWRIRDEVAGRKTTIKSGLPNKTVAGKVLDGLRVDRARGNFINPQDGKITMREFIAEFWPNYEIGLKPSSRRTEWSRVRTHILRWLGDYRLDQVDATVVKDWVRKLVNGTPDPDDGGPARRPLAPKSVRNAHGVLHKILQGAVEAKKIPANPAHRTPMPPREEIEMMFLTPPEIERLLAACSGKYAHWRPLVMLLVTTGLRFSEALALRIGKVDLFAGKVTVVQTAYEAGGGEYIYTTPKTKFSRRTVRITQELALDLTPLVAGKQRGDLLFTMPNSDRPVTRNFRQRIWRKICELAGLTGLRLHDLRHTVASLLISAGTPLTAVQRMLGHSSIKVTSDLYGHLMPEVGEAIVQTISSALMGRDVVGGAWGVPALSNAVES